MPGSIHEQEDLRETIIELLSAEWPGGKDHVEPDVLPSVIESDKGDLEMLQAVA